MMRIKEDGSDGQEKSAGLSLDELACIGSPHMLKAALEKVCGNETTDLDVFRLRTPRPYCTNSRVDMH